MKRKQIKLLSTCLSMSMLLTTIPVSADFEISNITNNNSDEYVEYQFSDEEDFSTETSVYALIGSNYKVTIPKVIVLSGISKQASYYVKVAGDIAGYETIYVVPEDRVNLYSINKDLKTGTITQDKTAWTYSTLGIDANGLVKADSLTAGKWSGVFNFNISMNKVLGDIVSPDHTEHVWKLVSSTPASCTSASTENYKCDCGEELTTHNVEALGHTGYFFENPYCSRCGIHVNYVAKELVPAISYTGHDYSFEEYSEWFYPYECAELSVTVNNSPQGSGYGYVPTTTISVIDEDGNSYKIAYIGGAQPDGNPGTDHLTTGTFTFDFTALDQTKKVRIYRITTQGHCHPDRSTTTNVSAVTAKMVSFDD